MTNESLELFSKDKSFGGWVEMYRHPSSACQAPMNFTIYRPPQAEKGPVPILYYLSGLTCTHENFILKAGAQQFAAEHGLLLVAPDTSPRNTGIPGEDDDFKLGSGAGFYVNAITEKWAKHYQMYDYVTQELPAVIEAHFPVQPERVGLFGHSMGGHGALVVALRNPKRFRSLSVLSPICVPTESPFAIEAFQEYLGEDRELWLQYDANHLMQKNTELDLPLLVDQGEDDEYLKEYLLVKAFKATCEAKGYPLQLRMHPGYGHNYFFVASMMQDHLAHHAKALCV